MTTKFKEIYHQVVGDDKLALDSYLAEKLVTAAVLDLVGLMDECVEDIYSLPPSDRNIDYAGQLTDWMAIFKTRYGIDKPD